MLSPQAVDLSSELEKIRAEQKLPGLAVAVVERDSIVARGVTGLRRADGTSPLAWSDHFHLGSNTLAMTASIVARLVDNGTLRWEVTIEDLLRGKKVALHSGFKKITLLDLLQHRSGITNQVDAKRVPRSSSGLVAARAKLSQHLLANEPVAEAGTFLYSNYGYVVVAYLLEQATGSSWEDLIRDEIFDPLDMDECGFGPTATNAHPNDTWAHKVSDRRYVPTSEDNAPVLGPATGVHCTFSDWARFAVAHMDGVMSPPFFSRASLDRLHEGHPNPVDGKSGKRRYAAGWGIVLATAKQKGKLAHDGGNDLNYARIVVDVAQNRAMLITCNAGDERATKAVSLAAKMIDSKYGIAKPKDAPAK